MPDEIKPCVIVPVYNHGTTVRALVEDLQKQLSCPIIIVDDGSDADTKKHLCAVSKEFPNITLTSHDKNRGKGAAFMTGITIAQSMHLTHALQIDADGQHDVYAAERFFDLARKNPDTLICGFPEYDASVPQIRLKGRKVANTWIKVVTFSPDIEDALCGFRIYPVEESAFVLTHCYIDKRMGFDIDILVRLYWRNCPVLFHPVAVLYPKDGISHFHLVRDNIRISITFTRLFFGMIIRSPQLLIRLVRSKKNENQK